MTDKSNTQAAFDVAATLRRAETTLRNYPAWEGLADECKRARAALAAQPTPEPVALQGRDDVQRLIDTLRTDARGGQSATVHDLDAAANLIEAARASLPAGGVAKPGWHFHRYVAGQERAEDVLVERATSLAEAIKVAARICPPSPLTVLIHAPQPSETNGTARQFVEWMKAQPEDREPTTIDGALTEFEAQQPSETQGRRQMTKDEVQAAITKAVRERRLSWTGFKKDDQDEYTIPVLSPSDYQLVRAIEAHHGIPASPQDGGTPT